MLITSYLEMLWLRIIMKLFASLNYFLPKTIDSVTDNVSYKPLELGTRDNNAKVRAYTGKFEVIDLKIRIKQSPIFDSSIVLLLLLVLFVVFVVIAYCMGISLPWLSYFLIKSNAFTMAISSYSIASNSFKYFVVLSSSNSDFKHVSGFEAPYQGYHEEYSALPSKN